MPSSPIPTDSDAAPPRRRTTSRPPAAAVLLVCLAAALPSSCSWILVRRAPDGYRPADATGPPPCTASLGPAIGDTWDAIAVGGGLVAAGTVSLVARNDVPLLPQGPLPGAVQLGAGLGSAAMFGFAARYGYRESARCRRLRDAFQRRLFRRTTTAAPREDATRESRKTAEQPSD
ncbi:MAG: hypothetical protein ABEL76_15620 [Bradymonadaceae bacterium]